MYFFSGVLPGYRQVGAAEPLRVPPYMFRRGSCTACCSSCLCAIHLLLFEPDYLIQRAQIDFVDDDAGIRIQDIQHRIGHIAGLDVLS